MYSASYMYMYAGIQGHHRGQLATRVPMAVLVSQSGTVTGMYDRNDLDAVFPMPENLHPI